MDSNHAFNISMFDHAWHLAALWYLWHHVGDQPDLFYLIVKGLFVCYCFTAFIVILGELLKNLNDGIGPQPPRHP